VQSVVDPAEPGRSEAAVRRPLPLIGREPELRWLERSIEEVLDGSPRVVVVSGEPGIGKTTLLRELRLTTASRGFDTASARANEDLPSPGLVFRDALSSGFRSEVADRKIEGIAIRGEDGDGRSHLDGLDRSGNIRAVIDGVLRATRDRPLALFLDDLHWADDLSLRLLVHLVISATEASFRQSLPLLVVVAARDLDPGSASARELARIAREPIAAHLELAGLESGAIDELVRLLGFPRPSRQLVGYLNATTRGNPLFVGHLVEQLARAGALRSSRGFLVVDQRQPAFRLPSDVHDAVASRLVGLDQSCRRVLQWAALLGDPCPLELLLAASDEHPDSIDAALEAAERVQLLSVEGHELRFAHPLVRQSLYAGWASTARARAHLRAAEALQRRADDRDGQTEVGIARHLIAAGAATDPLAVIEAASRAGEHAFEHRAWGETASFFRAAIAAAERVSPPLPDGELARLHARAAEASFRDQDAGPCIEHYAAAAERYRRADDTAGFGCALAGKLRAEFTLSSVGYGTKLDTTELERTAARLRAENPTLSALLLTDVSQAYWTARDAQRAIETAEAALRIGEDLGDDALRAEAHRSLALAKGQILRVRDVGEHLRLGVEAARRTSDVWLLSHLAQRVPFAMFWRGDLERVSHAAQEASELSRIAHDWGDHSLCRAAMVCVATACGRLEDAEREARHCLVHKQRSGYPWGGPIWLPALAAARVGRGAWSEAEDAIALLAQPGAIFEDPGPTIAISALLFRLLVRALAGSTPTEHQETATLLASLPAPDPVDARDVHAMSSYCALVELSAAHGTSTNVETFHEILSHAFDRGMVMTLGWPFLVPRVLGLSAAILGRGDEAIARLADAVARGRAIGARAEQGRATIDLARLLARTGSGSDRTRSRELSTSGAQIFAELGMTPSYEQARSLAVDLGADPAELPRPAVAAAAAAGLGPLDVAILARLAAERSDNEIATEMMLSPSNIGLRVEAILDALGCRTRREAVDLAQRRGLVALGRRPSLRAPQRIALRIVMFTDVGGSTSLFERLGDIAAYEVQKTHDAIVRDCLARCGGKEVRHTGDGIMASFDAAAPALECAVDIQRSLARRASGPNGGELAVRIGINAGEVIAAADDLYGVTVNAAARICAEADPGQILVGDAVRTLLGSQGIDLRHHGRLPLKGFTEPFDIFEARW